MDAVPIEIKDPRFLIDIIIPGQQFNNKNSDINWKIEKTKKLLKNDKHYVSKIALFNFNNNYISLNRFDWIDDDDIVVNYFIWYLFLLRKSSSIEEQRLLTFNFESLFPSITNTNQMFNSSVPEFDIKSKTKKTISIILIHDSIRYMNINHQEITIKLIKNKYIEFRRSKYFEYTYDKNQDKANWFLTQLNNDGVNLPQEVPPINKLQQYALSISLFLWDSNSFYSSLSSLINIERISKSEYLHKINLKWNQHSHRKLNKRNNVKAYNFEMSTDITKKLNELSKYHDKKKNSLVQYLIEQAYDDMKRK